MSDVPAHLSPSQITLLRGWPPELRHWQLFDYLSRHPEMDTPTWALWATELYLTGQNDGVAGAQLDFGIYEALPVE